MPKCFAESNRNLDLIPKDANLMLNLLVYLCHVPGMSLERQLVR